MSETSAPSNLRLVERLRDNAQGINLGAEGMGWGPADLYAAAADEIERLRAAILWVTTDAAYKAPEQIDAEMADRWMSYLLEAVGFSAETLADESCACKFSQPEETNRDKVLRGVVVRVTDGRLADMQRDAIRNEGIAVETIYHWHWAAAITELVAARAALRRINAINDNPARFDKEIDILSAGYGIETGNKFGSEPAECQQGSQPSSAGRRAGDNDPTAPIHQSWRPIETAPCDGTEFIAFHKEGGVCACFRTGAKSIWYCMDGWNTHKGVGIERPMLTSFITPPECWMPMPGAPRSFGINQNPKQD